MKGFFFAFGISVLFLGITLRALRRRVLREHMAVLWLSLSAFLVLLSLTLPFNILDDVAHAVGVKYGSDLLFVLALLFLIVLVFQLSLSLARLSAKFTRMVQDVAIAEAIARRPPEGSGDGAGRPA